MSEPRFIRFKGEVFNVARCKFMRQFEGGVIIEAIPFDGQPFVLHEVAEVRWPRLQAWLDAGMPWQPIGGGMLMDLDRWYEQQKGQADE